MKDTFMVALIFLVLIIVGAIILRSIEGYEYTGPFVPEVINQLGFDIQLSPPAAKDFPLSYVVSCANVNGVVKPARFSFDYGVTNLLCGNDSYQCPSSNSPLFQTRTSTIDPSTNSLVCSYSK